MSGVAMDIQPDILPDVVDAERSDRRPNSSDLLSPRADIRADVANTPDGWFPIAPGDRRNPGFSRMVGGIRLAVRVTRDRCWRPQAGERRGPDCTSLDVAVREAERLALRIAADIASALAPDPMPEGVEVYPDRDPHAAGATLRTHRRTIVLRHEGCIRVGAELLRAGTHEPARGEGCQGCPGQPYCPECQEFRKEVPV